MKFEFYVLNYNPYSNKVEMYNIFNNAKVQLTTKDAIKKYLKNPKEYSFVWDKTLIGFPALVKEIDSIIAWQEWSRLEYEISCGKPFETDCENLQKIDCYYQAHANIETITREVLRQYKIQLKSEAE